MAKRTAAQSALKAVPMLLNESVYIGVNIGKGRHVAGFLSKTLLERHGRFEACPALAFENSRQGFRTLINRLRELAPLEHCFLLMERTGLYHRPLEQYLQAFDVPVYLMHVQHRPAGMLKTDKRDALTLANQLYSQLELGVQVPNKLQLVRRVAPPTEAAAQLKGLIRHRYELTRESTQRRNKLTAICDEIFPEFTRILKDPNAQVALALREQFPTPQALATTSLTSLQHIRGSARSLSDTRLAELQRLAAESIGIKDLKRLRGLVLEQGQLIKELRLLREHIEQLEQEMVSIVEQCREGKILRSFPGVGPVMAATMIAAIGSIHTFPSASALKSYFGWAPAVAQSGKTLDRVRLTHGGTRTMKQIMFLVVGQAIRWPNNEWALLYDRLVKATCSYDERRQTYIGKTRVIGRVAGQMIEAFYALLKRDAELLSTLPPGQEPPPPLLYDPEVHRRHRQGHYKPLKSLPLPNVITFSQGSSPE